MKIKHSTLRYFSLIWITLIMFVMPEVNKWYDFGNTYSLIFAAFFFISLFFTDLVLPVFKVQTKIATLIGNVVSTVILGVVFYLIVTPIGIILKASGSDLLKKKLDKKSETYWISREKQPGSLKNQF